jgi:uncharacterized tellurite resistance protein B-like protein
VPNDRSRVARADVGRVTGRDVVLTEHVVLARLKAFFAEDPQDAVDDEAALHLAAAVLLVEVAKADHSLEQLELDRLQAILKRQWSLGDDDVADLVRVARDTSDESVSLHQHVDLINRRFSPEQKFTLMRGLWQTAFADAEMHHYEEALIRRLADLLYVSHTDFIRSKLLAMDT